MAGQQERRLAEGLGCALPHVGRLPLHADDLLEARVEEHDHGLLRIHDARRELVWKFSMFRAWTPMPPIPGSEMQWGGSAM